ncbi:DUF445 family protein [Neptunicella sp. SCSIO 80796]|uniref:DUF445 family protein n=1 Tax=Neptunicella plasticusilytica TaxID=3117012 RepID=UPI003A4D74F4
MNKNIITNGLAFLLVVVGFVLGNNIIKTVGLFALSGAITNSLVIYMLFEKVPGLYGSGVIPDRFEEFKLGIRNLMMEQFFTRQNIQRLLAEEHNQFDFNLAPILDKVDLSSAFDSLVEVIKASSFGKMLGMFGGDAALEPLREPFIVKMQSALVDISNNDDFKTALQQQLSKPGLTDEMHQQISQIVESRLNELTPKLVKDIIQNMIRQHLGWLVVWGGVLGGLIGLVAALLSF